MLRTRRKLCVWLPSMVDTTIFRLNGTNGVRRRRLFAVDLGAAVSEARSGVEMRVLLASSSSSSLLLLLLLLEESESESESESDELLLLSEDELLEEESLD